MATTSVFAHTMDTKSGGGGDGEIVEYASATRNAGAICDAISGVVAGVAETREEEGGVVAVEVATGTGQHAAAICSQVEGIGSWTPTDLTTELASSVAGWAEKAGVGGVVQDLVAVDLREEGWGQSVLGLADGSVDLVYCANMTHIAPIEATQGLLSGAASLLRPGGALVLYGPFMVDGKPTTESNAKFHAKLQSRDPAWGLRDIEADIAAPVRGKGLVLEERVSMPANNFLLVLRASDAPASDAPASGV